MAKPTKRKRSKSADAEARIVASEVILRATAINYALVAALDPSDPLWRRCWLELRCAAIGRVAEVDASGKPPKGHPPPPGVKPSVTPSRAGPMRIRGHGQAHQEEALGV